MKRFLHSYDRKGKAELFKGGEAEYTREGTTAEDRQKDYCRRKRISRQRRASNRETRTQRVGAFGEKSRNRGEGTFTRKIWKNLIIKYRKLLY